MENLPVYISITFILTTILSVFIFYKAANNSKVVLIIICIWLVLQTILSLKGFYTVTNTVPPRFMLLLLPPLIFYSFGVVCTCCNNQKNGKQIIFINNYSYHHISLTSFSVTKNDE